MTASPSTSLGPPRRAVARRWPVSWSLGAFAVVSAVLAVVVAVSHGRFPSGEYVPAYDVDLPGWLEGWYQFDAGWYERIATRGYDHVPGAQSPVAFFPAYPFAMRALAPLVGGSEATAGVLLTFLCGAASVALLTAWCRDRVAPQAVPWAVAAVLLFPYSWFLVGAVYGDALFLAASLAAFVLLERDRPLLAGLAGAVAAAGRPVGVAVVVALAVRALERRGALVRLAPAPQPAASRGARLRTWLVDLRAPVGVDRRLLRPADAGVLVAAVGLVGYCAYLWARFGDPFLFSSVQRYWDQPSGPATWVKAHLLGNLALNLAEKPRYLAGCVFQGALTVGALALVPRTIRRFGWGYGVLAAGLMAIPALGSKDFQGTGRYLLAAFPLFALAGEWLAERSTRVRGSLLAASALLLLFWAHLYARGFYVA